MENKRNGNCMFCVNDDPRGKFVVCTNCNKWTHLRCLKVRRAPKQYVCSTCKAVVAETEAKSKQLKELSEQLAISSKKQEENVRKILEITARNIEISKRTIEKAKLKMEQDDSSDIELLDETTVSTDGEMSHIIESMAKLVQAGPSTSTANMAKDWPSFKQLFEETTRTGQLSQVENLKRLRKCIKGEALAAVHEMMHDPANVPPILYTLNTKFGNAENVLSAFLQELLAVEEITTESPKPFLKFCTALHNLVENMLQGDYTTDETRCLDDQRLLHDLIKRLPIELQYDWAEEKMELQGVDGGKLYSIVDLKDWLVIYEERTKKFVAERKVD